MDTSAEVTINDRKKAQDGREAPAKGDANERNGDQQLTEKRRRMEKMQLWASRRLQVVRASSYRRPRTGEDVQRAATVIQALPILDAPCGPLHLEKRTRPLSRDSATHNDMSYSPPKPQRESAAREGRRAQTCKALPAPF